MTTNHNSFIDYFAEFRNMPKDWDQAQNFLNWFLPLLTNYLNSKTIGIYSSQEIPSGKQLYVTTTPYDALRKVIVFGPLPASGTQTMEHGITVTDTFRIINLYIACNDTANLEYFALQYFAIAAGDIVLSMDNTNVIVTTASDYSAYNVCYAVIEYCYGVTP